MRHVVRWVVEHARLSALLAAVFVGACSWTLGRSIVLEREENRLASLQSDAVRHAGTISAATIDGNLIGALGLLGLVDANFKLEASGRLEANGKDVLRILEMLSRSNDVEGAFIVDQGGTIRSSWPSDRSSTGMNVGFRPYVRTAMLGKPSVYAAVGTTTGQRTLYFSAPLREGGAVEDRVIGAVVARGGLRAIDDTLAGASDVALLLSPQGVVFASSRKEWVGFLAGSLTPERLKAIRELRQFGNMFEKDRPGVLPFAIADGLRDHAGQRYAVATTRVEWNDPAGQWQLVLIEDLSRSISGAERGRVMLVSALSLLLVAMLLYAIVRGQYRQQEAARQLDAYATAQRSAAERKEKLAAAGLHMQQARTLPALAQTFLSEAHALVGTLQGVVYASNTADCTLQRIAAYACDAEADSGIPDRLLPGEGLLGQCAIERRLQVLTTAPPGFATIRSGLGEMQPAAVMLAPVLIGDRLLAVVEVALAVVPGRAEREQFEDMLRLLAMNIEIVGSMSAPSLPDAPDERQEVRA